MLDHVGDVEEGGAGASPPVGLWVGLVWVLEGHAVAGEGAEFGACFGVDCMKRGVLEL